MPRTLTPDIAASLVALAYITRLRRRDEDGDTFTPLGGALADRVDHLLGLAEIDLDAPDLILAVVTGRGPKSTVPDDPSAVDADVWCCGAMVGSVTLKADHTGLLVPWGDPEHWASSDLLEWMGPALYTNDIDTLPGRIVAAVRKAAERAEVAPVPRWPPGAEVASALAERAD